MTVRRLKDITSEEKRLRKNIENDPDSYVLFLLTYYPNINKKRKYIKKSYIEKHLIKIISRYLKKFWRKNLKG
mgnify:CR=1 FL=1|jgi:hypothetical protein